MNPIPYGRQHIDDNDIEAVNQVLKTDYLTTGPKVKEFEQAFAKYVGANFAVAVANGTAALHLSAIAMNVKAGDRVLTTPNTFAATANCIQYCGAQVDFVDIDAQNFLMCLDKLEEKLKKKPKGYYKGVIPVDFSGYPLKMDRLKRIAGEHGLWIIEDACHAPGGYFKNESGKQRCGNGKYADLAIFSFHPVKHIAAGEGGMITTNNRKFYEQLKRLRTHGITKDPELLEQNHGEWYYEMIELGYNYRLTDIQAALGLSQLKKADQGLKQRQMIAEAYDKSLEDISEISLPFRDENIFHAFHLYVIQTEKRKALYDYLRENSIYTQVHYIPVHLHPYYRDQGWKKGDFPVAEKYYSRCLSLPMYPSLSTDEQQYVIKKIRTFFGYE